MTEKKDTIWNLRVRAIDVPLVERLNRAATIIDQPASQIVRQAIREKLDRLAMQFPQIDAISSEEELYNAEVA